MAIYYVRTDGNNANSGTGYTISNAWQTLAKAISTVAAGDIVYIAPGTYYETMTIATSGGASTIIKWIGDKEAQYFLDKKSGYVRITGCNSVTGIGAASVVINGMTRTRNYFYNLVIDGTTTAGTGILGDNPANQTIVVYDSIMSGGQYGARNIKAIRCFAQGGQIGMSYATAYNSISFGRTAFVGGSFYNCIGFGSTWYTFQSPTIAYNCIAFGGQRGFESGGSNILNCVSYFADVGFYGTSTDMFMKCIAIGSYTQPSQGSSAVNSVNASDIRYSNILGTSQTASFGNMEGKYMGFTDISKLQKLATALLPNIYESGWSTDLHEYTIAGQTLPRQLVRLQGATSPYLGVNTYYLEEGLYNNQPFYVNNNRNYILFYSSTLKPSNWVLTSGVTINESTTIYSYSPTINTNTNPYTNSGITGTIICYIVTAGVNTSANHDYITIGTYNGQNLYQGVLKTHILFYSSTLRPNNWVLTTGIIPNEAAVNYAYSTGLTGTYTNSGYTGTITNSVYTPITFTEDYDILGQPRRMGDGHMDCGPFEYSHVDLEWTTYKTNAPAIKITQAGQKRLTITAKAGVPKTISTWVNFNLSGGTNKPQLIISSSEDVLTTNPITITATGLEDTWELLTTTFTPKADGLIFINYYCRTTGTNSYAIFSDFKI